MHENTGKEEMKYMAQEYYGYLRNLNRAADICAFMLHSTFVFS